MKSETMTIRASEVKVGDVSGSVKIVGTRVEGNVVAIEFEKRWDVYRIPSEMEIVVSRPVPDPCPRGRMTIDGDGDLDLNGWNFLCNVGSSGISVAKAAAARRIVALWNEAEREPYRTTAEIEEQGK